MSDMGLGLGTDNPESAFMLLILKQGTQAGQYDFFWESLNINVGKGVLFRWVWGLGLSSEL